MATEISDNSTEASHEETTPQPQSSEPHEVIVISEEVRESDFNQSSLDQDVNYLF